ncbi:hypothetical protein [Parapedobacter sp.]
MPTIAPKEIVAYFQQGDMESNGKSDDEIDRLKSFKVFAGISSASTSGAWLGSEAPPRTIGHFQLIGIGKTTILVPL